VVGARVAALGRSSASMEYALTAAQGDDVRAAARIAIVASDGERAVPWTPGQRAKLEAFERRALSAG
jgi:acyl-CoA thioesterase FadM